MSYHDEKQFLELLQEHKSEDTKKARRNLSWISFVVISAWLLGIKLNGIRVLGADLSHTSEVFIYLICLILLIYWAAMFYLSWTHDIEIQKERSIQFQNELDRLLVRHKQVMKIKDQNADGSGLGAHDHTEVVSAVEAYERQKGRAQKAIRYARVIRVFELYTPVVLCVVAALLLIVGAMHTL